MEKGRGKQARRIEWITFAFALIVCLIAGWKIYRPRMGEETVAVITVDGKEIERIPLSQGENKPWNPGSGHPFYPGRLPRSSL